MLKSGQELRKSFFFHLLGTCNYTLLNKFKIAISKLKVQFKKKTRKNVNLEKSQQKESCVFLCIFDHWALFAQTVLSLRAAADVFEHRRRDVVTDTDTWTS